MGLRDEIRNARNNDSANWYDVEFDDRFEMPTLSILEIDNGRLLKAAVYNKEGEQVAVSLSFVPN